MSHGSVTPQSVSELTREIRELIEANFDQVCCRGEISNLVRARSGHVYFTLKDDDAQISAVMWKGSASRLQFDLEDGLEIIATGPVEVYPPRGSYQLIVKHASPEGVGPLELAFRQLQEKLAAEGLFDPARKKSLPAFPKKLALVTSPTGAAIRDMLQVLARRWPLTDVIVVPVPVQGMGCGVRIAEGIDVANQIEGVDLIITGRGGGSLEDLWGFNEEVVARAIARSHVPIISAVGHEIDVSISDLVADRRALTPTEAIEIAFPSHLELNAALVQMRERMKTALSRQAQQARWQLETLAQRRPFMFPTELFANQRRLLDDLDARLSRVIKDRFEDKSRQMQQLASQLQALSPLQVLSRGYSHTADAISGETIRSTEQISVGQKVRTRLATGTFLADVVSLESADPQKD